MQIKLSIKEQGSKVDNFFKNNLNKNKYKHKIGMRRETSLAFRLKLNAWRIKYCPEIKCVCKQDISIKHLFIECQVMKQFLPEKYQSLINTENLEFNDWLIISKSLIQSNLDLNL